MENLNAEQVKKVLECCASEEYICTQCPIDEKIKDDCECGKVVARNALALITSQEQRIKELTAKVAEWEEECDLRGDMWCKLNEENKRLTEEKERLLMSLANYDRLTDVRIAEEYYTAEAYEELREENERLRGERAKFFEYKHGTLVRNALVLTKNKKEFDEFCEAIKADTVRGMIDRITEHATNGYPRKVRLDVVDQIAKEMLEGE